MGKSFLLLAIGALVGAMVMWFWVTHTPPYGNMSLRASESHGYISIAWDKVVPRADVGYLDIFDGGNITRIVLNRDQLKVGSFTY